MWDDISDDSLRLFIFLRTRATPFSTSPIGPTPMLAYNTEEDFVLVLDELRLHPMMAHDYIEEWQDKNWFAVTGKSMDMGLFPSWSPSLEEALAAQEERSLRRLVEQQAHLVESKPRNRL